MPVLCSIFLHWLNGVSRFTQLILQLRFRRHTKSLRHNLLGWFKQNHATTSNQSEFAKSPHDTDIVYLWIEEGECMIACLATAAPAIIGVLALAAVGEFSQLTGSLNGQ